MTEINCRLNVLLAFLIISFQHTNTRERQIAKIKVERGNHNSVNNLDRADLNGFDVLDQSHSDESTRSAELGSKDGEIR